MTQHGPRPRIASVVLLAVVLASGLTGRGLAIAGTPTTSTADRPALRGLGPGGARLVGAPLWAPLHQDAPAECDVRGVVESPSEGQTLPAGSVTIAGWAADINATEGTGISEVRIALDADPEQGGVPVAVPYGIERQDIADLLGDERFKPSGFALAWDTTSTTPGAHTLYIQVRSACGWTAATRNVTVLAGGAGASQDAPPGASAGSAATSTPLAGGAGLTPTATPTSGTLTPTASPAVTPTVPTTLTFPTVVLSTATPVPTPTGAIPAPTGVSAAVNPFNGAITISWTPPPGAMVAAYQIVVNEPDGTQRPIREVPGSMSSATLIGLDPRIGYSFSVVAIDTLGRRGTPSSPVSNAGAPTVTPLPTPTVPPWCTPVPAGAPPGVPPICPGGPFGPGFPGPFGPYGMAGFFPGLPGFPGGGAFQATATLTSPNIVTLSWTPLPGAVSYTVHQSVNGGPFTQVQGPISTTTTTVTITPGTMYTFQVHALGPNNMEIGVSNITAPIPGGGIVPGVGTGVPSTTNSRFLAPAPQISLSQGSVLIRAEVRDVNSVPLPNIIVVPMTTPPITLNPPQLATDGNGSATFTLPLAGIPPGTTVTISGTANGVPLTPASFTVIP
ncbi:MAG TPA: fibronectin type III domain-containing protein [Chloroflexota bacterium]|nr:fibronectin type III domain-containing protein [Chloroflexota bacterium]